MFVDILSKDEKDGVFRLLTAIAKADGEISEEENQFLSSYADEHQIQYVAGDNINIENACSLLTTSKSKIIAMQEIIKIALSDGHYDDEERKGALAISTTLSLPVEKFHEIESWVVEGQSWVQKGEAMLASV